MVRTAMEVGKPPIIRVTDSQLGNRRVLQLGEMLPRAARAAADTVLLIPEIFQNLGFNGPQLNDHEEQVRVDGTVVVQLDGTNRDLHAQYAEGREQLARGVTMVVDTLEALLNNPCTPPELRNKLETYGRPVLNLVAAYNKGVQGVKAQNKALREEAAAGVDQAKADATAATLTTRVLRGEDVTADQISNDNRRRMGRS